MASHNYNFFWWWELTKPRCLGADFSGASVVKNPPANARDTGHSISIPGSGGSLGGGSGNPLQYSHLENSMDRGDWWAAVHGVAKSQTRLKQLSMHTCSFCAIAIIALKGQCLCIWLSAPLENWNQEKKLILITGTIFRISSMHYKIVPGIVLCPGDTVMNKTEKYSVLKDFAFW